MRAVVPDPSLVASVPPASDAPLPGFDAARTLRGVAAENRPFTLAGRRGFVVGTEARGVAGIWFHPRRCIDALAVESAEAGAVTITPVGVERRLVVRGRPVVERIFIARDLPIAILEWTAPEGATFSLRWRSDLALAGSDPGSAPRTLRWNRDGGTLVVAAGDSDDIALFALSVKPRSWEIDDVSTATSTGIGSRIEVGLAAGERVRLAIIATSEGRAGLDAALAVYRPELLVRARSAAVGRRRARGFALTAPDPQATDAVEWAAHRLDTYRIDAPDIGRVIAAGYTTSWAERSAGRAERVWWLGADAAWTGLGALTVGDIGTARDAIRFLGSRQEETGRIPHGPAEGAGRLPADPGGLATDATTLYLVLVARYVAWTGDLSLVREEWARVERALACRGFDADTELRAMARRELATVAESIGVGGWTAAPGETADPLLAASPAGVAFAAARTESGFRHWAEMAERGAGRGAWAEPGDGAGARDNDGSPDHARSTAMLLVTLVHGLLGVEPDAPKHRLRLGPQIPDGWERLEAERLRVGDAEVSLRYRREGDHHTFALDQESGGVPVTIIFEPALPARRLLSARVDGQAAELDPRLHGDRLRVPVQIVLDHERTIELVADRSSRGTRIQLPVRSAP